MLAMFGLSDLHLKVPLYSNIKQLGPVVQVR